MLCAPHTLAVPLTRRLAWVFGSAAEPSVSTTPEAKRRLAGGQDRTGAFHA